MSVRICLASSTSFGRSSLVAFGISADSSFLPGALLLERRRGVATLAVGAQQRVEVEVEPLVGDGGADLRLVLADELDVEHRGRPIAPSRPAWRPGGPG